MAQAAAPQLCPGRGHWALQRGKREGGGASDWVRYLAYDGNYEYFHNTATGEVSWEQPSDFREGAGP